MDRDLAAIARWIAGHAPDRPAPFRPPTSEQAVAEAEARLGTTFPASARSPYALADGQPDGGVPLVGAFALMPLAGIVEASKFLDTMLADGVIGQDVDPAALDVDPGIRRAWWRPGWILVMTNGSGDYLCLDLDPAEGGTVGQIITYYHDETFRRREASGLDALLARVAAALASGRYRVVDGMLDEVRP